MVAGLNPGRVNQVNSVSKSVVAVSASWCVIYARTLLLLPCYLCCEGKPFKCIVSKVGQRSEAKQQVLASVGGRKRLAIILESVENFTILVLSSDVKSQKLKFEIWKVPKQF
jgi:hypothetical protein